MHSARHQSRKVRHVDQVKRADFVCNLSHARKIDDPRIRAAAANDQFRTFLFRDPLQFVVIDRLGFFRDTVGNDLVGLSGKIQMMPVRKVSAMRKVQSENRIARLNHRRIGRHVRLRSRVRLHVRVLGAEELFGAVARQVLDDVGKLAAAVVPLARIPFRIFVREDRTHRLEHGFAHKILRSDQLQAFMLAAGFVINRSGNRWVDFVQRTRHGRSFHRRPSMKDSRCVLILTRWRDSPPAAPEGSRRLLECLAEERRQVIAIHIFIGRLARRVVSARKHDRLVIQPVPLELGQPPVAKIRAGRSDRTSHKQSATFRPAGELFEIRHRTDRQPQISQPLEFNLCLEPFAGYAALTARATRHRQNKSMHD